MQIGLIWRLLSVFAEVRLLMGFTSGMAVVRVPDVAIT